MEFMDKLNATILQPIVNLLLAVAVVYFLYGVMKFIKDQGSEDAQLEGKQHMIWGIIGLFIMVSVYGILSFINSFVLGFS